MIWLFFISYKSHVMLNIDLLVSKLLSFAKNLTLISIPFGLMCCKLFCITLLTQLVELTLSLITISYLYERAETLKSSLLLESLKAKNEKKMLSQ